WLSNSVAFTKAVEAVTPPAPTNGIVDDIADTFTFTPATGYTLTDHEYSLDGGTTILQNPTNPISIGDIDLAIGQVRVRVKAAEARNASGWLSNSIAFTKAVPVITPPAPTNGI